MYLVAKKEYNMFILQLGINMLTLVKDLGMQFTKNSKTKYRHGIFTCSKCGNDIKMITQNAKRNTYCSSCSRTTHGMSNTQAYNSWQGMITRTINPNAEKYEMYKDRKPPEKWMTFDGFWSDMKDSYIAGYTIERVDNDKPYSKSNCTWANAYTQAQNKTNRSVNSSSGYYGVQKNYLQYEAKIQANGVKHYLGLFKTAEEAAIARDNFIIENGTAHPLNFSQRTG